MEKYEDKYAFPRILRHEFPGGGIGGGSKKTRSETPQYTPFSVVFPDRIPKETRDLTYARYFEVL